MKDRPPTLDMLKVLRTGKPANWGSYDPQAWAQAMEREDFAKPFTAAMDCRGVLLGPAMAKKLDLAERRACSMWRAARASTRARWWRGIRICARRFLRSRRWIASRASASRGRAARSRWRSIAGDMFKDAWPAGFDTHLISNVLHDWDEPVVRDLLAKSHAALAPRRAAHRA